MVFYFWQKWRFPWHLFSFRKHLCFGYIWTAHVGLKSRIFKFQWWGRTSKDTKILILNFISQRVSYYCSVFVYRGRGQRGDWGAPNEFELFKEICKVYIHHKGWKFWISKLTKILCFWSKIVFFQKIKFNMDFMNNFIFWKKKIAWKT